MNVVKLESSKELEAHLPFQAGLGMTSCVGASAITRIYHEFSTTQRPGVCPK